MSSRVVTYRLTAAQREQLHTAIQMRSRLQTLNRQRERLALRRQVAHLRQVSRLIDLPSDAEIEQLLASDADGPDSARQALIAEQIHRAAADHRRHEVAGLAAHLGDRVTEDAVQDILGQLPPDAPPTEVVTVLVQEIRDNPEERAALVDELRTVVNGIRVRVDRTRRAQEKLDRLEAIHATIGGAEMDGLLDEARAAAQRGDDARLAALAQTSERLLEWELQEEEAEKIARLLADLWRLQGYSVIEVGEQLTVYRKDDPTGVLIDVAGPKTHTWPAAIAGGTASAERTVEAMRSHCRAAENVEKRARAGGVQVTVDHLDEPDATPARSINPSLQAHGRTARERARRAQGAPLARPVDGGRS